MLKQYNDYFSVDAIHFLVSVNDEEGNISDPNAEDTAWTAEQKAAAEELYGQLLTILKKTPSSKQALQGHQTPSRKGDAPSLCHRIPYCQNTLFH